MRVLLTGSHGYIGSVLTEELRRKGATVLGLDTNLYPDKAFLPWEGPDRWLEMDMRDVESRHLDGVDAVIHLAALSNDPLGELDPSLTHQINHRASIRLAELCKEVRIRRFVFSSSCSTYGASDTTELVDESAPFAPVTAYGVSPKMRFDLVLNNLFGWGFTTGRIRIDSDGTPWRPLVHIRDICQAAMLALEAPEDAIRGQALNVGDDAENHQIRDLGRIVQEGLPKAELDITGKSGPDTRSYRVSFQAVRRVLAGFRTQWTARKGVQELLEVSQRRGLTFEEFTSGAYANVEIIKKRLASGDLTQDLRPHSAMVIRPGTGL